MSPMVCMMSLEGSQNEAIQEFNTIYSNHYQAQFNFLEQLAAYIAATMFSKPETVKHKRYGCFSGCPVIS
jgi:hypothetical protein